VRVDNGKLRFVPCVPAEWKEFKVRYRYRETVYAITVRQDGGAHSVSVDGVAQTEPVITLIDDHREHVVEVSVPAAA
jgi:cellobiose phosphorylase